MSEILDDFDKTEKKLEIMFDFDNVWKSFEQQMNSGVKELLESLQKIKDEQKNLEDSARENICNTKDVLDTFLEQNKIIKNEVDEVKELVETINSIKDKNITFIEADVEYLTESVAKLLKEDTNKGLKEIRRELGEKFKKTYVSSKMIDQQLSMANKGLESVLQSCKEGNTNIATSEVLLYNLMETIRFIDTLSDNQKNQLISFQKNSQNSDEEKFKESNKRFSTRIDKIEKKLESFTLQTENKLNTILDILQKDTTDSTQRPTRQKSED